MQIFPTLTRELELMSQGYSYVAGLDEAGRGPWAGPVTAGCVVVTTQDQCIERVRDSKKMSSKSRVSAYDEIIANSTAWGVGIVSASQIDMIGIQQAVLSAMQMALAKVEAMLGIKCDYLLIDGNGVLAVPGYKMDKIKSGDLNHYSIAAASVLAKVTRDRIMYEMAEKYPEYGFEKHVGYGTAAHIAALQKYGPCEIHRQSYKPVAKFLGLAD